MKNHIRCLVRPPERAKKKKTNKPACCHMKVMKPSKFSRHMRNKGNAAKYFMFF